VEYYKLALLITTGVKSTDYLNGLFENALIKSDSSSGRRLTVDCLLSIKECWNLSTSLFTWGSWMDEPRKCSEKVNSCYCLDAYFGYLF